jgi:hypothetical protein
MIEFLCHDIFSKEFDSLSRKFPTLDDGLEKFKNLCEVQFHPRNPEQIIAPGKLHRLSQNDSWSLWKIELLVPNSGLRPNQWPRIWFVVKGGFIGLLTICSHVDNYDDDEMTRVASERISDLF